MKKIILTSALAIAISVPVLACGGPGKLFSELDLTSDQMTQLKELRQEKRAEREAFKSEHKAFKERRQSLLNNYSEAEAETIASEIGDKAKARTLSKIQHMQKIMAILTPEQQEKFKALMVEHREEQGHGRKGHHGMFF